MRHAYETFKRQNCGNTTIQRWTKGHTNPDSAYLTAASTYMDFLDSGSSWGAWIRLYKKAWRINLYYFVWIFLHTDHISRFRLLHYSRTQESLSCGHVLNVSLCRPKTHHPGGVDRTSKGVTFSGTNNFDWVCRSINTLSLTLLTWTTMTISAHLISLHHLIQARKNDRLDAGFCP